MSKLIDKVNDLAVEVYGKGTSVSIDVDKGVRVWNKKGEQLVEKFANTQTSGLKQVKEFLVSKLTGLTGQLTESIQEAKVSDGSGEFPAVIPNEEVMMAAKKKTAAKKTESVARNHKLLLRLSESEYKDLKKQTVASGTPMAQLLRDGCSLK